MKIDVEGFEENVLTRGGELSLYWKWAVILTPSYSCSLLGATNLFTKHQVHYIISEVSTNIDVASYLSFFRDLVLHLFLVLPSLTLITDMQGYNITINTFDGPILPSDLSNSDFHEHYGSITDVFMKKMRNTVEKPLETIKPPIKQKSITRIEWRRMNDEKRLFEIKGTLGECGYNREQRVNTTPFID